MAPPRLVDDVVDRVVQASLQYCGFYELQAAHWHFFQLRLVSKAVKAQAHRSYPDGVSMLANSVVRLLLERTMPSTFAATLKLAKPVLGESRRLKLGYPNKEAEGDDPAWTYCAALILEQAENLRSLLLDCYGASLHVHKLELPTLVGLQTLDISGGSREIYCSLDLSGMAALRSFTMSTYDHDPTDQPLGLRLPSGLVNLNLSDMGLTGQDILALDIPSMSSLQYLIIDAGGFEVGGATALHLRQLPRLHRLSLHGPWVATALKEIRQCKALEEVDLIGHRLASVAELQLDRNSTITSLNLSSCYLSDPAELGLASNQSLTTLKNVDNRFSSFLFGLDTNTTLRNLDLSFWRSGDDDGEDMPASHIRQLSTQLARNTILESLGLCCSLLDNTAGRELRLERTTGLKELDLSQNDKLGDEGVMPLLESIEKHGIKVCVVLNYTKVSEKVRERFRRAAE